MQALLGTLDNLLGIGIDPQSLSIGQVALRASLIYLAGWFMVRLGEHRFLGKNTAFDIVLGFIFGTTLARAINGSGPFYATLAAGVVLLALHWFFATMAYKSKGIDRVINGQVQRLVDDGSICWDAMRKYRINERLLRENLRMNGGTDDISGVAEAGFEPSGNISVIKKKEHRVVEVAVEDGVQTVRIEWS